MNDVTDLYPPAEPHDEIVAVDDLFARAFEHMESEFGWWFGNSLVTRSARWGLICRIDVDVSAVSAPVVNRVLCWGPGGSEIAGTATVFRRSIARL